MDNGSALAQRNISVVDIRLHTVACYAHGKIGSAAFFDRIVLIIVAEGGRCVACRGRGEVKRYYLAFGRIYARLFLAARQLMVDDHIYKLPAAFAQPPVFADKLPLAQVRHFRQRIILAQSLDRNVEQLADMHHHVEIDFLIIALYHAVKRLCGNVQPPGKLADAYALLLKYLLEHRASQAAHLLHYIKYSIASCKDYVKE